MDNHIVPECYIDTMLVRTLVPPAEGKRYNHQKGCRNVGRELKEKYLKDKFAVGIIDKDKNEIDYLAEFNEIQNYEGDLILYKHYTKHHYFIKICPAIEKWIFKICAEERINLKDYNLPGRLDDFMRITKSQNSSHDKRFLLLFDTLKESNNVKVDKLRSWIKILKEKNYDVDINELKNA